MTVSSSDRPECCWAENVSRERRASVIAIKAVHTVAFFATGSCLAYLTYSGLTKRSDRRAAIAGAVVAGEALSVLALVLHGRNLKERNRRRRAHGGAP